MASTILISGASGQLGRRVTHHLLETNGVEPSRLIATTRSPDRLSELAERGVQVRYADFDDGSSVKQAFSGADKVLIISTDLFDLDHGKRLKQHETAIAAAKEVGASHAAYTSMLFPEPGSPIPFASDHLGSEQALKESGLSYTIFQNNAYHENLVMSLSAILASGKWFTSVGDGRTAYVGRDDIASAIASRLSADTIESVTLALTGTRAYTNSEVAVLATVATGRPIEVIQVSDDDLALHLNRIGIPDPFVRLLVGIEVNARKGLADLENDLIRQLTNRQPQSLEDFLKSNGAAFIK
jgi:NAD(P)H dehydrogenase (quinone)